jgi:hypothetical protein
MNLVARQERTQRIRYGLTGLAVVFLFVLLGTAISRSADEAEGAPSQNIAADSTEPNEPLAEIGAAPNSAAAANEEAAEETAPPVKP